MIMGEYLFAVYSLIRTSANSEMGIAERRESVKLSPVKTQNKRFGFGT